MQGWLPLAANNLVDEVDTNDGYYFDVQVTDPRGGTAHQTFTVVVSHLAEGQDPEITSTAPQHAQAFSLAWSV